MNALLEKIICLSCDALQREDEYLRECLTKNRSYSRDRNGILSINNERYYQFVIARHLFCKLPKRIALESNLIDLVVFSEEDPNKYEMVVEMKRWMSSTGKTEISSIRDDFDKLSNNPTKHKLMLIFSSNPSSVSILKNIEFLSNQINRNLLTGYWQYKSFDTIGIDGSDNKFWVAGYEVN